MIPDIEKAERTNIESWRPMTRWIRPARHDEHGRQQSMADVVKTLYYMNEQRARVQTVIGGRPDLQPVCAARRRPDGYGNSHWSDIRLRTRDRYGGGAILTCRRCASWWGMLLVLPSIFARLGNFLVFFNIVKKPLIKVPSPNEIIRQMVNYAAISRRDGALALEEQIRRVDNPFLVKGLQMLVDGQEEETIRGLMELEIDNLQERHANGKKILEFMGAAAPAFGMIGTLIGLVQMLQNLSSPDQIGAGMAVALITTFYGSLLANLVFIPLAGKLGMYSKAESLAMEMIVEGICTISRGENPTVVREKMQAFISPAHREDIKATI